MATTETLSLRVPSGFKARARGRFGAGQVNGWAVQVLSAAMGEAKGLSWKQHLASLRPPVNDPDPVLRLRHARLR